MPLETGKSCDKQFFFQHGWGFTGECWLDWLPGLVGQHQLLDRGYCRQPLLPVFSDSSHSRILVCHSLGLHIALEQDLSWVDLLVIVGGFAHLHGTSVQDGRFTRKHLQRMFRRLAKNPESLVRDFHRDCQYSGKFDYDMLDKELLAKDLHLLDTSVCNTDLLKSIPNIILVHGDQDRIVPLNRAIALQQQLPGSELTVVKQGGHGLLFTHHQLILQLIYDKLP